MIKRNIPAILFLIVLSMAMTTGCTINDTTGLITISNYTKYTIISVIINSNLLSANSRNKLDYWFYQNIKGEITITSADLILIAQKYDDEKGSIIYQEGTTCTFKTGYRYEIRLVSASAYMETVYMAFIEPGIKAGADKSDSDFYHYPGE